MTPSHKRRVLVTRPKPQARALEEALSAHGFEPVALPLLAIEPVDATAAHNMWQSVAAYDMVIFTSANGVAHAWPHAPDALCHHPVIAVVGPATARAVELHGGTVWRVAPEHVAESLADVLGDVAGKRIFWPRGAETRPVLANTLRARGAQLDDVIVYRTGFAPLPSDAVARVQQTDILTFASPSAVRRFADCFDAHESQRVVCIGPITAAAAREHGVRVDAVAAEYTATGLLKALQHLDD